MSEATLYYLNWDQEGGNTGPASTLFHKYGVESVLDEDEMPPTEFTDEEFNDLYREIATVEGDYSDPEQLWKEWNAGSGYESLDFYEAEVRSMSVGDVVELDDTYHLAKSIGFDEIEVGDGKS